MSKDDVINILNNCSDVKQTKDLCNAYLQQQEYDLLKFYIFRIKDLILDNNPAIIYIRGENTKTKTDRTIFLTEEVTNQIKVWLKYRYRTRRVCHQTTDKIKENKKSITGYRTPLIKH